MNPLRAFIQSRIAWAILAGLVLSASFPNIEIAGLAWVAPALILLGAIGLRGKSAFRVGYVAGLAHHLASLCWLLNIPVPLVWKWAPALGWLALAAFLALYTGTWVWLCWRIFPVQLDDAGKRGGIRNWAAQFLSGAWLGRTIWAISGATAWVAMEMTMARFLGGFPWNLLGDSQYRMLPLIQLASFTGVYGVSFLAVWMSLSLLGAGMVMVRSGGGRSACVGEIIVPALVVAVVYASGYAKLLKPATTSPEISVSLVQPSIPQEALWNEQKARQQFLDVLRLSEQALTNHPDILVWPEGAVPGLIRVETDIGNPVMDLAKSNKVWIIICADDFEPHPNATTVADSDFFNSSFLVSPEGRIAANYRKQNLVIFGEYVPLVRWLPFLKYLTPIEGGYTAGKEAAPFALKELGVNVSVLICFEDVFPHHVRRHVFDDTDFLVNLTNDGWFGEGAAQRQQAAGAIFRAVENGVPLVRCSNNGLTGWADAQGRLRQVFESAGRGIYGPGYLLARIPVLGPGGKREPTYYRSHGDVFGWGCVAFALLQVLRSRTRRRDKINLSQSNA